MPDYTGKTPEEIEEIKKNYTPEQQAADRILASKRAQAARAGLGTTDAQTAAGGLPGAFGQTDPTVRYTVNNIADTTTAGHQARINALQASIGARPNERMTGARLDQTQADQIRGRQMGLADALTLSAAGQGPSAARSTLTAGSDQAMADAMALAKSSRGNPGAAMKNALDAQGRIGVQTANQAAGIAANEQLAARAQLAGVLDASRGQDLGAATTNATLAQQTGATNLAASIEQQKQKDAMIADLMKTGMSLDQAQRAFILQQRQFNADLLARQEAAEKGVSMQSAQTSGQVLGAGIGAAAALGAGLLASDKRVKKNIGDGDEPTRSLLKSLRPQAFEYDDEHQRFGRGRRVGVMAQDVERGRPDLVVDDSDGVKKIDVAKALSASLAGLGSIDKRLSKLEGGRRGRAAA